MTLIRAFTIHCNTCNDSSKVHILAKEARAEIKSNGWTIRKGIHTCPKCKPVKAEKPAKAPKADKPVSKTQVAYVKPKATKTKTVEPATSNE